MKKQITKNNETDSKYEVKVTLREADEDIYDTVQADDTVTDPEHSEQRDEREESQLTTDCYQAIF